LMPKSYKSLNNVVAILKADESLFLDIDGHTDAQGADDKNQVLSENRAKAVKDYLVAKELQIAGLPSPAMEKQNLWPIMQQQQDVLKTAEQK